MNKIVRDHYPVSQLPDDLRAGFDDRATVRVVIEEPEPSQMTEKEESLHSSFFDYRTPGPPLKAADLAETIRVYKATRKSSTDEDEAVRRIRELRDEWDDE